MARDVPLHISEGAAGPWVPWFAWHPVRLIDGVSWAWLRIVYRRRFYAAPWFVIPSWLQYKSVT